jgi:hypothetical protein
MGSGAYAHGAVWDVFTYNENADAVVDPVVLGQAEVERSTVELTNQADRVRVEELRLVLRE